MSEFVDYLKEVFVGFGPVQTRKMFGGYGVYHQGIMFGLVADSTLYLKVDKENVHYFEKRDLPPFEYDKGDKVVKMSYCLAPDEVFDDSEEATIWAKRSYEAACRAKK